MKTVKIKENYFLLIKDSQDPEERKRLHLENRDLMDKFGTIRAKKNHELKKNKQEKKEKKKYANKHFNPLIGF